MKIRIVLISVLLSFVFCSAFGQKSVTFEADAAYESGEYYSAIDLYKVAYNKTNDNSTKAEIIYKTGECYRKIGDTYQCEVWYKKAVKIKITMNYNLNRKMKRHY